MGKVCVRPSFDWQSDILREVKAMLRMCLAVLLGCSLALTVSAQTGTSAEMAVMGGLHPVPGQFLVRNFRFQSGEVLPELKLHYQTLGKPRLGPDGHVANAVLVLHGTGGSGNQFLVARYAGELFGPGQPLDVSTYFVVLPDDIGHGQSSKPSDGLRAKFPHYDYADMVRAEHALVVDGLKIDHLRLVTGTSMGCMHAFMWGEDYPDFIDALMPLACLPVAIGGRNRMWRQMLMNAIRDDPDWKGGEYATEPRQGLRTAVDMLLLAGSAPIALQREYPTGNAMQTYLARTVPEVIHRLDANDLLYQVASSRDYDPSARLSSIRATVMWINSEDDFINPPYLGVAQQEVTRMPDATYVLIPAGAATHGHGTHTWAAVWKSYLVKLLATSDVAR
ncbi:MAG: alpha/beta fold hydrolase [Pseudomonadota bacterium]|nr:alpha/beta fold hydrolase [Pseudomonadota bacterium]